MATQRGVSLIEVLVAMLILSFGMLAYTGLQASAIKAGKLGQFRTVATQLATDFADRMRANSVAATNGLYDYRVAYAVPGAAIAVPGCAVAVCTAAEIAAIDLAAWRNTASRALPGGSLFAERDLTAVNATVIDFWVLWQDPTTDDVNDVGQGCPAADIGNNVAGPRCMHFRFAL